MKQRKHILIVVSVLVVAALGLGGWYLLSDRQAARADHRGDLSGGVRQGGHGGRTGGARGGSQQL